MKGSDYFVLGLTFITGMLAGGYLYITSFATSYKTDEIEDTTQITFVLRGEKRGAECDTGGGVNCPSFELHADRTYSYILRYTNHSAKDPVVTGVLGKNKFNELIDYIATIDLQALEKETSSECSNLYDTNYAYNLVYQGESYLYDTCNTYFKNSVLAVKFYPLWTRLATTTPTAPLLEDGLSGFLQQQLDKRFTYDDE